MPELNPVPKVVFGPLNTMTFRATSASTEPTSGFKASRSQILSLLVNRPGQIVSRDELQRHLWEGTTFVDFEQGSTQRSTNFVRLWENRRTSRAMWRRFPAGDTGSSPLFSELPPKLFWRWLLHGVEDRTQAQTPASTKAGVCRRHRAGRSCGGGYWVAQAFDRAARSRPRP